MLTKGEFLWTKYSCGTMTNSIL